jgi:hypothetical protein
MERKGDGLWDMYRQAQHAVRRKEVQNASKENHVIMPQAEMLNREVGG